VIVREATMERFLVVVMAFLLHFLWNTARSTLSLRVGVSNSHQYLRYLLP